MLIIIIIFNNKIINIYKQRLLGANNPTPSQIETQGKGFEWHIEGTWGWGREKEGKEGREGRNKK